MVLEKSIIFFTLNPKCYYFWSILQLNMKILIGLKSLLKIQKMIGFMKIQTDERIEEICQIVIFQVKICPADKIYF